MFQGSSRKLRPLRCVPILESSRVRKVNSMMNWHDWKIGTRLGILFGSIQLALILLGGLSLFWLGNLNARTIAVIQQRYNTVELTHQIIEHSIDNARITVQLFEITNPGEEQILLQQNDS